MEEEEQEQEEQEEQEEEEEQEQEEEELEEHPGESRPQVRRGRSRQGGAVGRYAIDHRGLIVGSGSQLPSSQHLPSKTPHKTLLYATGDNPDAFVASVADLLHCREAGASRDQLPDMVSRLVDTATFTETSSRCPPPTPTNLENLEGWDCNGHLGHIRSLLQLANRVTLLAHYHIGGSSATPPPSPPPHTSGTPSWRPLPTWPAGRRGATTSTLWPRVGVVRVPVHIVW